MAEFIIDMPDDYPTNEWGVYYPDERDDPMPIGEPIVRCSDCKHATLSSLGYCKYCEKFVLPDEDGFGPDPRVNLPLDFFCAWGERRDA